MADGDLDSSDFSIAFEFTRPRTADYRDAAGAVQEAAINVPRFDHDAEGVPLGLLVEGGPSLGQADRVIIDPLMLPEDITGQEVTVFQSRWTTQGTVERRAWYSRNAIATINALLTMAGHHGAIGVISGFRENKGGHVRYRGRSWYLATLIAAGEGYVLSDDVDRPLIGG